MNSKRKIITLGVASATAIIAALFARDFIAAPREPQVVQKEEAKVQVLALRQDVRLGQRIEPSMLEWREWPESLVLPGMFTQQANPNAIDEIAGSRARSPLSAGEPVLSNKILRKGGSLLAGLLGEGMRAFRLKPSQDSVGGGTEKFQPDDRVDVLFTRRIGDQTITDTVLENARVLPDPDSLPGDNKDSGAAPSMEEGGIILEVTPRQAAVLSRLRNIGELSLTLRPSDGSEDPGPPRLSPKYAKNFAGKVRIYRYGIPSVQVVRN